MYYTQVIRKHDLLLSVYIMCFCGGATYVHSIVLFTLFVLEMMRHPQLLNHNRIGLHPIAYFRIKYPQLTSVMIMLNLTTVLIHVR